MPIALASEMMGLGMAPAMANLLGDVITSVTGVGTAQSGAALLSSGINVATANTSNTAFVLPASQPLADPIMVIVSGGTAPPGLVFPPAGGTIQGGSANASFSCALNKPVEFVRVSATAWFATLSA